MPRRGISTKATSAAATTNCHRSIPIMVLKPSADDFRRAFQDAWKIAAARTISNRVDSVTIVPIRHADSPPRRLSRLAPAGSGTRIRPANQLPDRPVSGGLRHKTAANRFRTRPTAAESRPLRPRRNRNSTKRTAERGKNCVLLGTVDGRGHGNDMIVMSRVVLFLPCSSSLR